MINEKLQELMHQELDGSLSPKRKEELNELLESNEEARLLMNKLRLVHSKLVKVEVIEPPASLKESVMRSLPVVRHSIKHAEISLIAKIVSLVEMPRFQMAGMFSLGMAAALLLFVVAENYSGNKEIPSENAAGALIGNIGNAAVEVIDSKVIEVESSVASVKTSRHDMTVIAEINVESPDSRTVQLFITPVQPGELRFSAMEQVVPNLIYANFSNDYFSAAIAGSGKLVLAFEDSGKAVGPIQVEVKTENSSTVESVAIQKVNL
jgi:hypothetical protein